jgi:Glycosyl hydrolase family 3 C-terminal domain
MLALDQTLLWTPGTNATTGEHVDLSDLSLVGAQLDLIKAVKATGKPTVVVLVSGKPIAEPWIAERKEFRHLMLYTPNFVSDADAVLQQFYPGELVWIPVSIAAISHTCLVGWCCYRRGTLWGCESFWCALSLTIFLVNQGANSRCRQAPSVVSSQCWNHTCILQLP